MTVSNTIRIEHPTDTIKDWCREHLEIPNPEYAKKLRMNLWTDGTPKLLYMYEERGDEIVLPFGVLRSVLPMLTKDACAMESEFATCPKVDYYADVSLYDYQKTAVDACIDSRYGILQSPAGSGKTQMGIALIVRYGRKALWLTHTQDLLDQSKERALRYIDGSLIGTITNGKVSIGKGVTFATIQTMCRLDLAQYRDQWDVIVVDECHRVAGTPTSVTQFFKVLNALAARHKYGLSATVHRADGMIAATYALLGQVIYTVPENAVADKIMKVGIKPILTNTELTRQCLNADGTRNYTRLIGYLSENNARNRLIGSYIVEEADHPCLILSERLEHLDVLMHTLPVKMREKAVMISSNMNTVLGKAQRKQAIEDMRLGNKQYLFATYSLAREGLDIPRLERLFMTTPVKDYAVVVQTIGRIARACEGKQSPVVMDFVDNIPYTQECYKQRLRHYKKAGAYLV